MVKKLLSIVALVMYSATAFAQPTKICGTNEPSIVDNAYLQSPEFIKVQEQLEEYTKKYAASQGAKRTTAAPKIIPIVFHVIHNYGPENISKQDILDQLDVLNKDFQRLNADTAAINPIYKNLGANPNVQFRLAQIDPNGKCTDGIVRVASQLTYDADDKTKALSYWPNNKYFNIWVVNGISGSGGGSVVLGRSQFPGGSNATDGVLLNYQVCNKNSAYGSYGRTLTHEIGHSLNLRHIWGDQICGSDMVDDTPMHTDRNSGCPKGKTSGCNGVTTQDLFEDYMDYSDGGCQNLFTTGQNTRMQAVLNGSVNGRNNLYTQTNINASGTNDGYVAQLCLPKADFFGARTGCTDADLSFTDVSWGGETASRKWVIDGAVLSSETDKEITARFANPGKYTVKLIVSNATGSDSLVRAQYIQVYSATGVGPFVESMESPTFLTDNNWRIESTDSRTWERTTNAAYTGNASFYIKYFGTAVGGTTDAFYTSTIDLSTTTTALLKFKVAHAKRNSTLNEKLSVAVSKYCGLSYATKFSKTGTNLATAPTTNANYVPASQAEWREETVNLSSAIGSKNVIIRFESESANGNNIYIDDIQLITDQTAIKTEDVNALFNFTVQPNPTSDRSTVTFTLNTPNMVSLIVTDILGREVAVLERNASLSAGDHAYAIENLVKSGLYFVKLKSGESLAVQKMLFTN